METKAETKMETKDVILKLRTQNGLSQDELLQRSSM